MLFVYLVFRRLHQAADSCMSGSLRSFIYVISVSVESLFIFTPAYLLIYLPYLLLRPGRILEDRPPIASLLRTVPDSIFPAITCAAAALLLFCSSSCSSVNCQLSSEFDPCPQRPATADGIQFCLVLWRRKTEHSLDATSRGRPPLNPNPGEQRSANLLTSVHGQALGLSEVFPTFSFSSRTDEAQKEQTNYSVPSRGIS